MIRYGTGMTRYDHGPIYLFNTAHASLVCGNTSPIPDHTCPILLIPDPGCACSVLPHTWLFLLKTPYTCPIPGRSSTIPGHTYAYMPHTHSYLFILCLSHTIWDRYEQYWTSMTSMTKYGTGMTRYWTNTV